MESTHMHGHFGPLRLKNKMQFRLCGLFSSFHAVRAKVELPPLRGDTREEYVRVKRGDHATKGGTPPATRPGRLAEAQ
jgi:hypothetical protein